MLKAYLIVKDFLTRKEQGAAMAEYGLLVGLIAVACIAATTALGGSISGLMGRVSTALAAVAA